MKYTRLGRTGLEVSRICFGTMSFGKKTEERPWVLPLDDARPLFRAAWEGGINFFDTANVYPQGTSEEITGALISELAPRRRSSSQPRSSAACGPVRTAWAFRGKRSSTRSMQV